MWGEGVESSVPGTSTGCSSNVGLDPQARLRCLCVVMMGRAGGWPAGSKTSPEFCTRVLLASPREGTNPLGHEEARRQAALSYPTPGEELIFVVRLRLGRTLRLLAEGPPSVFESGGIEAASLRAHGRPWQSVCGRRPRTDMAPIQPPPPC